MQVESIASAVVVLDGARQASKTVSKRRVLGKSQDKRKDKPMQRSSPGKITANTRGQGNSSVAAGMKEQHGANGEVGSAAEALTKGKNNKKTASTTDSRKSHRGASYVSGNVQQAESARASSQPLHEQVIIDKQTGFRKRVASVQTETSTLKHEPGSPKRSLGTPDIDPAQETIALSSLHQRQDLSKAKNLVTQKRRMHNDTEERPSKIPKKDMEMKHTREKKEGHESDGSHARKPYLKQPMDDEKRKEQKKEAPSFTKTTSTAKQAETTFFTTEDSAVTEFESEAPRPSKRQDKHGVKHQGPVEIDEAERKRLDAKLEATTARDEVPKAKRDKKTTKEKKEKASKEGHIKEEDKRKEKSGREKDSGAVVIMDLRKEKDAQATTVGDMLEDGIGMGGSSLWD